MSCAFEPARVRNDPQLRPRQRLQAGGPSSPSGAERDAVRRDPMTADHLRLPAGDGSGESDRALAQLLRAQLVGAHRRAVHETREPDAAGRSRRRGRQPSSRHGCSGSSAGCPQRPARDRTDCPGARSAYRWRAAQSPGLSSGTGTSRTPGHHDDRRDRAASRNASSCGAGERHPVRVAVPSTPQRSEI